MFKFAHMADIHIGAHKDKRLMELEIQAFNESIDICINQGVKFIIIVRIGGIFINKNSESVPSTPHVLLPNSILY